MYWRVYAYKVYDFDNKIDSGEQLTSHDIWSGLISTGYLAEDEVVIKPGDFRAMIDLVPFLSINLYLSFPDAFIPYLFFTSFAKLAAILDFYEIPLPSIPAKQDYEGRCYYYLSLNDTLLNFRDQIGLSPEEFCAFLYDFAPSQIEDLEVPSTFNRVWISGGFPGPKKYDQTYYWGNNSAARKGDLMLLYETSPVSAITSIWRLTSDGYTDPFFHWSASASMKHVADIPHVTLKELREDAYFANHPLIRRKMQGVNGTAWSIKDYENLLRILSAKGEDASSLPKLEGMEYDIRTDIILEKDVEEKLLIPLLSKLGLQPNIDYVRQLPIHAGRGHRIFPDFAVYHSDIPDMERAHILIEAKLEMRNEKDLTDAFNQACSYAKLLSSSVVIVCDKSYIYVFTKNGGLWDIKQHETFMWQSLSDGDNFFKLAKIFDKKQYRI